MGGRWKIYKLNSWKSANSKCRNLCANLFLLCKSGSDNSSGELKSQTSGIITNRIRICCHFQHGHFHRCLRLQCFFHHFHSHKFSSRNYFCRKYLYNKCHSCQLKSNKKNQWKQNQCHKTILNRWTKPMEYFSFLFFQNNVHNSGQPLVAQSFQYSPTPPSNKSAAAADFDNIPPPSPQSPLPALKSETLNTLMQPIWGQLAAHWIFLWFVRSRLYFCHIPYFRNNFWLHNPVLISFSTNLVDRTTLSISFCVILFNRFFFFHKTKLNEKLSFLWLHYVNSISHHVHFSPCRDLLFLLNSSIEFNSRIMAFPDISLSDLVFSALYPSNWHTFSQYFPITSIFICLKTILVKLWLTHKEDKNTPDYDCSSELPPFKNFSKSSIKLFFSTRRGTKTWSFVISS